MPEPIANWLRHLEREAPRFLQRRADARLLPQILRRHDTLLAKLQGKRPTKILFMLVHGSVWKMDSILQAMCASNDFEPLVLVCPYTPHGEEHMQREMDSAFNMMRARGYPVMRALDPEGKHWVDVKNDIDPDIVFFTNPHPITKKEYYQDCFETFLSCYVPYHHEVAFYNNGADQYNRLFHNAMWRIYSPHSESERLFREFSRRKGENIKVVGYPACEGLYLASQDANRRRLQNDPWKRQDGAKKRIIFAPHHTIDHPAIPLSTFLCFADFFTDLAVRYKEKIQWAFKPHPILKPNLYGHKEWGPERTDSYYNFWASQSYTQLEEGSYENLFIESDAMIHDCASFLAEYLYLMKPTLYLVSEQHTRELFNYFGNKAYDACQHANSETDIERFLIEQIGDTPGSTRKIERFFTTELEPYFTTDMPSQRIISDLKSALGLA